MSHNGKRIYALTAFQEGLLVHCEKGIATTDYLMQSVIDIAGAVNTSFIRETLDHLAEKYEVLLSQIILDDDYTYRQSIAEDNQIEMEVVDYEQYNENMQIDMFEKLLDRDQKRGFDVFRDLLFRVKLVRLNEKHAKLLFTYHHIILDSRSVDILFNDFVDLYNTLEKSQELTIRKGSQFSSYVDWINAQDEKEQLAFWKEKMQGYDTVAEIQQVLKATVRDNREVETEEYSFQIEDTAPLFDLQKRAEISFSAIIKAAWAKILFLQNRVKDVVFGDVVSGREVPVEGIEDMVGVFIKTLPLRISYSDQDTVLTVLNRVFMEERGINSHSVCSLAEIQAVTEQRKDIFRTIFVFTDYSGMKNACQENNNVTFEQEERIRKTSYDLSVDSSLSDGTLEIKFLYNKDKYSREAIDCIAVQFRNILKEFGRDATQLFDSVDYLGEQKKQILAGFNHKVVETAGESIVSEFEKQADIHGDKLALVFEDRKMTYRELDQKANQVALFLKKHNVKKGDLVALLSKRGPEMIVGLLGIMKAGAAYVPVDFAYPQERIEYILSDSKPACILCAGVDSPCDGLAFDLDCSALLEESTERLAIDIEENDLAYVIYTSGTSGNPKGVMVEHRGVVSLQNHFRSAYGISSKDVIAQFANIVFDASVWEISMALLNGATLVILSDSLKEDTNKLSQCFEKNGISVVTLPPNFYLQTEGLAPRLLITAGSESGYDVLRKVGASTEYVNAYGPTETTICATDWIKSSEAEDYRTIPIGKPIYNMQVYIMNDRKLEGVLVPGELCVGGAGIARGYLNNKELTEAKFTDNPFDSGRLYRTGDLARWLPDGSIEFMGRIDNQVKIRGFRIELGEIETRIRENENVNDVAVVLHTESSGEKSIWAYIVLGPEGDIDQVRDDLCRKVPDYMMPAYFCVMDEIPTNQSGKVDVKKLPSTREVNESEYIAPSNPQEEILCDLCADVLSCPKVGVNDRFSSLGGDSIKAIRLVSKVRAKGYELSVQDILTSNVIKLIANKMNLSSETASYDQGPVKGKIYPTQILREFERWGLKKPEHFNQDVMIRIPKVKHETLVEILAAIVEHHDMLRAVYIDSALTIPALESVVTVDVPVFSFDSFVSEAKEIEEICNRIQASFSLEKGPLFKAAHFCYKDYDELFLCSHHLVIDGISWRIIIDDIFAAINQKKENTKIELPKKTASFKQWSELLQDYTKSTEFVKAEQYWKERTQVCSKISNRLSDKTEEKGVDTVSFVFDESFTSKILKESSRAYNTNIFELLISAFGYAFSKYDKEEGLVLILEGHGREEIHKRINIGRTVGWFTTVYPIFVRYESEISDAIIEAKETIRRIPKHGFDYGFCRNSLPVVEDSIYFNYLGQMDSETENGFMKFNSNGMRSAAENDMIGNLSVSAIIINRRLEISMKYRRSWCSAEIMIRFGEDFQKAITDVVAHCSALKDAQKTPSDYSAADLSRRDLEFIRKSSVDSIQDIFSLIPIQEGILFEYLKNKKTTAYVIQQIIDIGKEIKANTLAQAISLCILRHDALRAAVCHTNLEMARLVILEDRANEFEVIDLSGFDADRRSQELQTILQSDVERGFDLEKDILFRAKYIKMGDENPKLVLCFHHIIVDGWSQSVIFKSIQDYYNQLMRRDDYEALRAEIIQNRAELPNYSNYLKRVENIDRNEGLDYWRNLICDYEEVSEVKPLGQPGASSSEISERHFELNHEISEQLVRFSTANQITMNTIMESAIGIVLQKYNATKKSLIGKVVSGRDIPVDSIEEIVGLFVNTIPVPVNNEDKDRTIRELLSLMQKQAISSLSFAINSLADIQKQSSLSNHLFQTLLVYENQEVENEKDANSDDELQLVLLNTREETGYDQTIFARVQDGILCFDIMFDLVKYSNSDIDRYGQRIALVLTQFARSFEGKVSEISILDKEEEQLVVTDFNRTEHAFNHNQTIIDAFEENCEIYSDKIMLRQGSRKVTFGECNQKTNQIARYLRKMGVTRNDFVAVYANRSIEMLFAIYGIIKAGAAYVPIDPAYPIERIQYMLNDCSPKAIITYGTTIDVDIPCIDLAETEILNTEDSTALEKINTPEDRVYMIYTSGTTGNPKGVINKHVGMVNLFAWLKDKYVITPQDAVLFKTTYIFDVSVSEILLPVFTGARLIVAPQGAEKDPEMLANLIIEKNVSLINFVPSMLSVFLHYVDKRKKLPSLRYIFAAGEALGLPLIQSFYGMRESCFDRCELVNLYGPTEASIYATHYECHDQMIKSLIGQPLGNLRIYIVQDGQLCGIGVPGELCIAGCGLAEGYCNSASLTDEKFIISDIAGQRIYRTGDLAQWLPDGNIEYFGRIDDQVKVRGFRIEIGDIENCLHHISGVNDVVVLLKNDGDENHIVAYFTSDEPLEISDIRTEMRKHLPEYMIPSHMMQIDSIPTTHNGKLDRRSLPDFVKTEKVSPEEFTSDLEKTLYGFYRSILHVGQIGANDNFFELGGHSIGVMRLWNMILSSVGVDISIVDLFEYPTIRELAEYIEGKEQKKTVSLPKALEKDKYLMSPAQRRIFIVSQLEQTGTLYNMPMRYVVNGTIDSSRVLLTLKKLVSRHEVLRTVFFMEGTDFYQKILDDLEPDYSYILDAETNDNDLFDSFVRPFQLEQGPLFRMQVVEREDSTLIFLDMHHIISDGLSYDLFLQEFSCLYAGETLPEVDRDYKDYSEWINTLDMSQERDFWLKTIGDSIPVLDFPYDKRRPEIQTHRGNIIHEDMSVDDYQLVRSLAEKTKCTDFMIFASVLMFLLERYCGQEEIIIGTPISGRIHESTEKMFGAFINSLPIKGFVNEEKAFNDLLSETKQYCVRAYEHQRYPFEKLVEDLDIQHDMSRNPLFDVMLTFHNASTFELSFDGVKAQMMEQRSSVSKYDLDFTVMKTDDSYSVWLEYSDDLLFEQSAKRILHNYLVLLHEVLIHQDATLSKIDFIDEDELALLRTFNQPTKEDVIGKFAIDYIEQNAALYPERAAAVFEGRCISFKELNDKADVLASKLFSLGINQHDYVAVLTERSIEFLIAICGIMKIGATYVPIDRSYPRQRIEFIISDSHAKAVITQNYQDDLMPRITAIDITKLDTSSRESAPIKRSLDPDDVVYCLYTSGTTGNPKGVLVKQKGIANLCENFIEPIWEKDDVNTIAVMASFAFDSSVKMVFSSLMFGKTLHIISEDRKDNIADLVAYLEDEKIEAIDLTPSYLRILTARVLDHMSPLQLKVVLSGGEELTRQDLGLLDYLESLHIYNVYGPTEATVDTTGYLCTGKEEYRIPIGRPIANAQVYIVHNTSLCGIGIPGELCISGIGVAAGYLNQPELTNEKFIANPFGEGMLYKTGDLARWTIEGNIEFLGRIDEQIKLRGYRIELDEVSKVLMEIPQIENAIAMIHVDNEGDKSLSAFFVSKDVLDVDFVKSILVKRLPQYMVPAFILQLDEIPVTERGKVDKKKLSTFVRKTQTSYSAPQNAVEKALCDVMAEVLNVDRVGTNDNFYALGGDSIKAIIIVSKLKELGYVLSVRDILSLLTVKNIAAGASSVAQNVCSQDEVNGVVPLTPIVRDFIERDLPNKNQYCQDVLLPIDELNEDDVRKIFDALTTHHDMLRGVFKNGQIYIQSKSEWCGYELSVVVLDETDELKSIQSACIAVQQSFDLENGPLIKLVLFESKIQNRLFICVHHLLIDGVSWRILLNDMNIAVEQIRNGEEIRLANKSASYIEWAEALEDFSHSSSFEPEKKYWHEIQKNLEMGRLPIARASRRSKNVQTVDFSLNKVETRLLVKDAHHAFGTQINDLLLSAFVIAVKKQFGTDFVSVCMEGHGREEIHRAIDVTSTVGWFTSKYPVILKCMTDISSSIIATKDNLHRVMRNGLGSGLVENSENVNVDVFFNYLGEYDNNVSFGVTGENNILKNGILGAIDINGMIEQGVLSVMIAYDSDAISNDKADSLKHFYHQALKDVIACCVSQSEVVKTISDFMDETLTDNEWTTIANKYGSCQVQEILSLTPLQEGMLFHKLSDNDSSAYVVQVVYDVKRNLNKEVLERAVSFLMEKYPVLRAAFIFEGMNAPKQVILSNRKAIVLERDLRTLAYEQAMADFETIKNEQVNWNFDLENDTLIRFVLVYLPDGETRMIITHHHIILDGWCLSILMHDLEDCVDSLDHGEDVSAGDLHVRADAFVRYIKWLYDLDMTNAYSYYSNLLSGYEANGSISSFSKMGHSESQEIKHERWLTKELSDNVIDTLAKANVTNSVFFETAWGLLLQFHNYSNDVVFGKVISGRNAEINGIASAVGPFVNTIPVRVTEEGKTTVRDLLHVMHQQGIKSNEYFYCSLSEIQKHTEKKGQLIQSLYVFENYYVSNSHDAMFSLQAAREQTNYDLTLTVYFDTAAQSFSIGILCDDALYCEDDIKTIMDQYEMLLASMIRDLDTPVENIELASAKELEIINASNNTKADYGSDVSLASLFHKQALATPDAVAIVAEGDSLTYHELDAATNRLAEKLRACGVEKGDFVMIIGEKHLETVVGICGIVKAGAVYVPFDPTYPQKRVEFMIQDCKPKAILVYDSFFSSDIPVISLRDVLANESEECDYVDMHCTGDDLAYVIYTSGTTGQPKGSIIPNKAVVRLVRNVNYVELNEQTVILMTGSLAFDASTLEIWGSLLNGGRLVLTNLDVLTDSRRLKETIEKQGITTMWMTSTLFNQMIMTDGSVFDGLKHLLIGGEKLSEQHVRMFKDRKNGVKLTNGYGPTENTTFTTTYEIPDEFENIPIGKPISNTTVYVMQGDILCGIGIPGELCAGGDGVGRGYLNRPELTAEKFVKDPFSEGKMYRTGDLVRWLSDGNIEFLGRIDDQVKIRGFRIELGEIEKHIREIERVKDCAVVVREDTSGEKAIYAYYVAEEELSNTEIRNELSKTMPDYMVPSYMMRIESIPVTRNGKLDKRALPDIEKTSGVEYVAPSNEIEKALCDVLSSIMEVNLVGVKDSFFGLGGDSIKAIRVVSMMSAKGYELSVKDIMMYYIVELVAQKVHVKKNARKQERHEIIGVVENTPIINTFIGWNLSKPGHFNQDVMMKTGIEDVSVLEKCLAAITAHHEILRAVFREDHLHILPYSENKGYEVFEYECKDDSEVFDLCTKIQASIDLGNGPLLKAALFKSSSGNRLFICVHHLIIDVVSWQILLEDLQTLILQFESGREAVLPDKTASYPEWASMLKEYGECSLIDAQRPYWDNVVNRLSDACFKMEKKGSGMGHGSVEVALNQEITNRLTKDASEAFNTKVSDLLISALVMAVGDICKQKQVSIMMEGHGREELHKPIAVDRTIGWFTSMYPLVVDYSHDMEKAIVNAKEEIRQVPNNGIGFGVIWSQKEYIHPEITFNYLGNLGGKQSNDETVFFKSGISIAEENRIMSGISVNASIADERLVSNFNFDLSEYDYPQVQCLADTYLDRLKQLIEYCCSRDETQKTISDMLTDELLAEDLESINSLF